MRIYLFGFLFILSACEHGEGSRELVPTERSTVKADDLGEEKKVAPELRESVHWIRNSAEHRAAMLQAFQVAGSSLEAILAEEELEEGEEWAVAFDADETIIDNSQRDFEVSLGDKLSFFSWALQGRAAAKPGALTFMTKVKELGGKIAIVTNRPNAVCESTQENLAELGFPTDIVLCKGKDGEKEPRWQSIEDGEAHAEHGPLTIVMWLGDSITDFPELSQESRFLDEAEFSEFGRRFIIIPNPMHGSWQKNPKH